MDLADLAGLAPLGVLAELVNADGTMMRRPDLQRFAQEHELAYIGMDELVRYRVWLERGDSLHLTPARLLHCALHAVETL